MKAYSSKNKLTFVASGGGNNCPTMTLAKSNVKIRDDYGKGLRVSKAIVRSTF